MSIKATRTISRATAQAMLMSEIPVMTNGMLASLLDELADSGESMTLSIMDNFIVYDQVDEES